METFEFNQLPFGLATDSIVLITYLRSHSNITYLRSHSNKTNRNSLVEALVKDIKTIVSRKRVCISTPMKRGALFGFLGL